MFTTPRTAFSLLSAASLVFLGVVSVSTVGCADVPDDGLVGSPGYLDDTERGSKPQGEPGIASGIQNQPIVGGSEATEGAYPFIVWLNGCGGTLIGESWVMTAAHCQPIISVNMSVFIGGHTRQGMLSGTSGEERTVSAVTCHPSYKDFTSDFDFCLLELSAASTKTPIAIDTTAGDRAGEDTIVMGWGDTAEGANSGSEVLLEVTVPVVSNATCLGSYPGSITDQMVCAGIAAGGIDSCQGDSGGPLVTAAADALVGVVSWGQGCAQPNFYGVYARISSVTDWICTTTSDAASGCTGGGTTTGGATTGTTGTDTTGTDTTGTDTTGTDTTGTDTTGTDTTGTDTTDTTGTDTTGGDTTDTTGGDTTDTTGGDTTDTTGGDTTDTTGGDTTGGDTTGTTTGGGTGGDPCTIDMSDSSQACPNASSVCGANFFGGSGCVVEGLGNCYASGVFSYKVAAGEVATVVFDQPISELEVFFAHTGGGSGLMTFFDANDVPLAETLTTNGNCASAMPANQTVTFALPATKVAIVAMGSDLYVDTMTITTADGGTTTTGDDSGTTDTTDTTGGGDTTDTTGGGGDTTDTTGDAGGGAGTTGDDGGDTGEEPPVSTCPSSWCSDGDLSTIDICQDDGQTCSNVFDVTQEGSACVWGVFCCADGKFHADCSDPTIEAGQDCPNDWCNDGDPGTIDTCSDYIVAGGSFTCGYAFDTSLDGTPCVYGANCCADGQFHADCSDPTISAGQDCPNGWCNDGDPTTSDTCSDYTPATGQKTCSYAFNSALDGTSCTYGLYCCDDNTVAEACGI
ncbi:MAG: trypsin [Myxococcota bacterium]|jgi:trypsin